MRRCLIKITFGAVLISAIATVAHGQGSLWADRARLELERTDELIQRAQEPVRASNSVIAAQALERAVKLQESAWGSFRNQAYGICASLTLKAREQVNLAISASRVSEQFEGVSQRRLERASELLEQARETLDGRPQARLDALLDNARTSLDRAWEFHRSRQFRVAVKLAEQVEQTARKIIDMGSSDERRQEEFQQRLENVERLLEYARETAAECESEAGRKSLEQAEKALNLARELNRENHPVAALQALKTARDASRLAARDCQGTEKLKQRHERLRAEAGQLADRLGPAGQDGQAWRFLRQAREQLELAQKYISQDQPEAARVALQAAQLALRQAQNYSAGGF